MVALKVYVFQDVRKQSWKAAKLANTHVTNVVAMRVSRKLGFLKHVRHVFFIILLAV